MKVIRAEVLGYCMGVRRAVDMAYASALAETKSPGGPDSRCGPEAVYTIGPLIHNPQVLSDLRKRGVGVLDPDRLPGDLRGALVIIRAHGITPALEAELEKRGASLLDATCPTVKASQKKARSLSESGYRVFLAGEKHHGEIIGIQGYAGECVILANDDEAKREGEKLALAEPGAGTALIGQTTISPGEYGAIGLALRAFFPDILIVDTICPATKDRQDALKKLCPHVEAVVVAGGRDSANTRRLASIAESQGRKAWLVESAGEIDPEIGSYPAVGLSAGASTPSQVIDEIEAKLLAMKIP